MILEAIVTTRCEDGTTNIAPMGPLVDDMAFERFELRPFQTSTTFANLCRTGQGVLHVTDDVMVFVRAALNCDTNKIHTAPAERVQVDRLQDACRWYEFEVKQTTVVSQRASLQCRTVHQRQGRHFFGFNRAKHAVIEACILATRVQFLPFEEIDQQLNRLAEPVRKTGGQQENQAFQLIRDYVREALTKPSPNSTESPQTAAYDRL